MGRFDNLCFSGERPLRIEVYYGSKILLKVNDSVVAVALFVETGTWKRDVFRFFGDDMHLTSSAGRSEVVLSL